MRFLLRLALWATPAFLLAWWLHAPYERWIGGVAAGLAAPRGAEIEIVDLEVFFPFDLGVFVALCLASTAARRAARWRAIAIGIPVLVAVELLVLYLAFRILMASGGSGYALRLVNGMVRLEGLMAAAAAWGALLVRSQALTRASRLFESR